MNKILTQIVGLGGFLNGSKSILGLIAIAYAIVTTKYPQYKDIIDQILQDLGIALLPLGLTHKAIKKAGK